MMAKDNKMPATENGYGGPDIDDGDGEVTQRNDRVPQLEIAYRDPAALSAAERQLRKVEPNHVTEVARSIERLGFSDPVLIAGEGRIVDGHVRVAAAKELGLETIPCIRVDHLSEEEIRLLRIGLNKLQEKGAWDFEALKLEFEALYELEMPVEVTGFETPELDIVLSHEAGDDSNTASDEADPELNHVPESDPEAPAVTRPGDLWQLGEHRILYGDARSQETVEALLGDQPVRMVFTDPPYNVPVNGHVCGKGAVQHEEFAMASGEMSAAEFARFLQESLEPGRAVLTPGGLAYVCMDWRHDSELKTAARKLGLNQINLCIWVKSNGGMGGLYRSQHELVFVFCNGKSPAVNNVALGKHGRNRTNVWSYPGVNTLDPERKAELCLHPTVKPVELVADAMRDASHPGEIVLDPFLGSGTTVIAAEATRRRGYGIELSPKYVDTAVRRWEGYAGAEATLVETGENFTAVATRRALEDDGNPETTEDSAEAAGGAA